MNASFEVCTYADVNSTYNSYEKVVKVLKKNNIYHFANGLTFKAAP
jgi:hypothetical protein